MNAEQYAAAWRALPSAPKIKIREGEFGKDVCVDNLGRLVVGKEILDANEAVKLRNFLLQMYPIPGMLGVYRRTSVGFEHHFWCQYPHPTAWSMESEEELERMIERQKSELNNE